MTDYKIQKYKYKLSQYGGTISDDDFIVLERILNENNFQIDNRDAFLSVAKLTLTKSIARPPAEDLQMTLQRRYIYRAGDGYWATPETYDVKVYCDDKLIAVVGFQEKSQKEGAVFMQLTFRDPTYRYHTQNEAQIQAVARIYAKQQTGWNLDYHL
jgi:hypothetical protein